jgi:hypothetical protein
VAGLNFEEKKMTTLYVANASKQRHDFIYRVPEENSVRRQQINPGSQITVYQPNAPIEVLTSIVDQHKRYGLTDVAEIDRRKPFVGLCYSFDKPIKVEKIMYADEHNAGVLQEASQEARKMSAAALHAAIERATEGTAKLESLELEVVEQNGSTEPGLNERVEVTRENKPVSERAPRGRPRKS